MSRPSKYPHGQLRQSQVVTTFGPGSLVDLPRQSALVGGLDTWSGMDREIYEPRLVEKIKRLLGLPHLKLFAPPPDRDDPTAPQTGITAWQFPEWFVTQDVHRTGADGQIRSRYFVHRLKTEGQGKFFRDADKVSHSLVPIRFVRACRCGHIGDINWWRFVHQLNPECRRQLFFDERGTSGDLADIVVRCACGESRRMADATATGVLGHCDGARPWLGVYETREPCAEMNRLLVRHASHAYFPQQMSVISLPDRNESLEKAVNQVWEDYLKELESVGELQFVRKKMADVKAALDGYTDEEVFDEIQQRRGGKGETPLKSVKAAEFEVLSATKGVAGDDVPDGDFYARQLPHEAWADPLTACVEKVVLVHRLREVIAQVAFSRFEAVTADVEGELELGSVRAPLAKEVTWLPAVENRGEGIFIQFRKADIDAWLGRPEVKLREDRLRLGFQAWERHHSTVSREFPPLAYYLLHSISHLLMTAIALECGYPSSSIRERVYAVEDGYAILLYTGSPDSEGTLGGLVEAGKQIRRHLRTAVDMAKLCSNDPVCSQHEPEQEHECRFLHGAACHGCLLVSETSCEQHNDYLDRSLVVQTVGSLGAEFFSVEVAG
jgi:hypothetical protein